MNWLLPVHAHFVNTCIVICERWVWAGLGLETCGLGTCGLGLGYGLDGLDCITTGADPGFGKRGSSWSPLGGSPPVHGSRGKAPVGSRRLTEAHFLQIILQRCNRKESKTAFRQDNIIDGGFFSERELTFTFAICCRPSVCRLSVVGNARAPYSGGCNFRQYFYGIRYLGHPMTSTENFTEIVPGEPLRRGS